jgi:hypothetical protein
MSQPTVAAVMLVNGREAMARKAVECMRNQTYRGLRTRVLDTTPGTPTITHVDDLNAYWTHRPDLAGATIGALRNHVNALADGADIIVHFDSDDYSHPRRVEEQVALLESRGADAVGYNEALFWREPYEQAVWYSNPDPRYCLGASLCYWLRTWERKPFKHVSQGEDFNFCIGLNTVGVSSLRNPPAVQSGEFIDLRPRFIARIHAGNTSTAYAEETIARASEWRLVPEWNRYCADRMAL